MNSDSRERMVQSAAELLRERGYSGTSFRDVIAHSGAPRGSIYHHFPQGKAQLVEQVVQETAQLITAGLAAVVQANAGDPVAALHTTLAVWREILDSSQFRAGCPIVAVAVEAHDEAPQLTAAVAAAFAQWNSGLAQALVAAGVAPPRASSLATIMITAIEGAVIVCRTTKNIQALDEVGVELELLLRSALPAAA